MKFYIGELEFKTKKECENYTRDIINNLGVCKILQDNFYYNFFLNLLKNHPDYKIKFGEGINYFYIIPNPLVKKYFQLMIKRVDDTDIDFSWVYCCQFKIRNDDLIKAMREAISKDIINFKNKQENLICKNCKNKNCEFHVDHDNPSFKKLKDDFIKNYKEKIPNDFESSENYLTQFKLEDFEFKNKWIEYHNKNCNLEILCKNCNLKKSKK